MNSFMRELNQGLDSNPSTNVFIDMWSEYEKVVLRSLLTTFGLDFINDQDGGDVDTVRSVSESHTFKNKKYAEKYDQRGEYDTRKYHGAPAYKNITAEQRKKYNESGTSIEDTYVSDNKLHFNKGDGPTHRASLDHVISAHEIHDDPVRMLASIDGVELANDLENLRYTNLSLNSKMKDMSIEDFIKMCEENPEKVNWMGEKGKPLPEDVKERLRRADKESRKHYEATISQLYYTSPQFYADVMKSATKRGTEMGLRQALGFVFIEIWYACKKEMMVTAPGSGINECIKAILDGIKKGVKRAREKYKTMLSQFGQGFIAGELASLATSICNIFVKTQKNVVCYIRQAYAAIVQAGNILFVNPNELLIGEQIKTATIILGSGASVIAGMYAGDAMALTPIGVMPKVGEYVTKFVTILVGGLLSCTLLIMLDRSKLINSVVEKLNQYTTTERRATQISRRFNEIAAEVGKYDIDSFIDECKSLSTAADIACRADSPEELDRILDIVYSVYGIKNPWDGDFDDFLNDDNGIFDFS